MKRMKIRAIGKSERKHRGWGVVGRPKIGMTEKKRKAAQMLADGMTLAAIGDELGVDLTTVSKWKHDDEFVDLADMLSKRNISLSAIKARIKLDQAIDEKGVWPSMTAATNILREYQTVKGIGSQSVIVTFGGIEPGQVSNVDTELPE